MDDPGWFTDTMYRSSARLSAYLAKKHDIPIDRDHIIGHNEVPYPNDHYDPGNYWDWDKYIGYVRQYAGESFPAPPPNGTTYSKKIDNSKAKRFSAGNNWGKSSYSSQRYKTDYRYAEPGDTYGAASFKVKTPTQGDYEIYGWWPADRGYNDQTVFWIYTFDGWVSENVNQRTNGGRWVYLGTYPMDAWDDCNVEVSNQSSGSGYIVADAIKVVKK